MSSAPLLGACAPADGKGDEGWPRRGGAWLGRVVDTEEAWAQLQFAVPMILTNMSYYGIPLVSVMFSGHLGDVHLAGATLGNSWATVNGYAFVGLWSGLICGLTCQASALLVITIRTKWSKIVDAMKEEKANYVA